MTTIRKYLDHTVTIVKVTKTRGTESTKTIPNQPAYIDEATIAVRKPSGVDLVTKTLVMMLPDADVTKEDRLIVDGVTMPIYRIDKPRFVGSTPNHLEVLLD